MQPDLPSPHAVRAIPGLGPQSRRMLQTAGITSLSQLRALGSVRAYVRVKRAGCRCTLNLLWALESALTGEDWRVIAKVHRTSLLLALEETEQAP